jgi:pyridoxal phosphate enzyme (YggS family)
MSDAVGDAERPADPRHPGGDDARAAELARALAAVEERVTSACAAAGRDRGDVTLVVVTKTFPAADALRLAALGVADLAENRDQEAGPKAAEVAAAGVDVRWHFVGQLQRNKARSVARYAEVVHSVDRLSLVTALDRAAADAGRALDALLQVDLGGGAERPGASRGGAAPADVPALADAVAATSALRLRGLMAVAPREDDPAEAFARLAALAAELRRAHPAADWVSAGMSGDLEQAVAAGATHLRVGSAVLGSRPPLQ